jgi:hypothetical protein
MATCSPAGTVLPRPPARLSPAFRLRYGNCQLHRVTAQCQIHSPALAAPERLRPPASSSSSAFPPGLVNQSAGTYDNTHSRTTPTLDGDRPLDQSEGAMKAGAIGAWTAQDPAPSPCAACGRLVTGHAGDAKVVVEHVQAVFCSDCFEDHPNREEWTCAMPDRGRPAHRRPTRSRR